MKSTIFFKTFFCIILPNWPISKCQNVKMSTDKGSYAFLVNHSTDFAPRLLCINEVDFPSHNAEAN